MKKVIFLLSLILIPMMCETMAINDKILPKKAAAQITSTQPRFRYSVSRMPYRKNIPKIIYNHYPEIFKCLKANSNRNGLRNPPSEVLRPTRLKPPQHGRLDQHILDQKRTKLIKSDFKENRKFIPKNSNIIFIPFKPWNQRQNFINNQKRFNANSKKHKSGLPVSNFSQNKKSNTKSGNNKDLNVQQNSNVGEASIFDNITPKINDTSELVPNKTSINTPYNIPIETADDTEETKDTVEEEEDNVSDNITPPLEIVYENEKNFITSQEPNINITPLHPTKSSIPISNVNESQIHSYEVEEIIEENLSVNINDDMSNSKPEEEFSEPDDNDYTPPKDVNTMESMNDLSEVKDSIGSILQDLISPVKIDTTVKNKKTEIHNPFDVNKQYEFFNKQKVEKPNQNNYYFPNLFNTFKNFINPEDPKRGKVLASPEDFITVKNTINVLPENSNAENVIVTSPKPFDETTMYYLKSLNNHTSTDVSFNINTTQKFNQNSIELKIEKTEEKNITASTEDFKSTFNVTKTIFKSTTEKLDKISMISSTPLGTKTINNSEMTTHSDSESSTDVFQIISKTQKSDQILVTLKEDTTENNIIPTESFKIVNTNQTIPQRESQTTKSQENSVNTFKTPTVYETQHTTNYISDNTDFSTEYFRNMDLTTPEENHSFHIKLPLPEDEPNHMFDHPEESTQTTVVFEDDILQTWGIDNEEKISEYDSMSSYPSYSFDYYENSKSTTQDSDQGLLIKLPFPEDKQNDNLYPPSEWMTQTSVKKMEEELTFTPRFLQKTQQNSEETTYDYKDLQDSYETETDLFSTYYSDYSEKYENINEELFDMTSKPVSAETEEIFTLNFNQEKSVTEEPDQKMTSQTLEEAILTYDDTNVEDDTQNYQVFETSYISPTLKSQSLLKYFTQESTEKPETFYSTDVFDLTEHLYEDDYNISNEYQDSVNETNFSRKFEDFTRENSEPYKGDDDTSTQPENFIDETKFSNEPNDMTTKNIDLDEDFDESTKSQDSDFETYFPKDFTTEVYIEDFMKDYEDLNIYSTDDLEYMPNLFENNLKTLSSETEDYTSTLGVKELTDPLIVDLLEPITESEDTNLETNWKNSRKMHFNQESLQTATTSFGLSPEQQRRSDILINEGIEDYNENFNSITSSNYTETLKHKNLVITENSTLNSIIPMIPSIIADLRADSISSENYRILSQAFGKYWGFILTLSNITNLDMLPLLKMKNEEDFKEVLQAFGMKLYEDATIKPDGEDLDYDNMYNYMSEYNEMYQDILEDKSESQDQRSKRQENLGIETTWDYYENIKEQKDEFDEYVYEDVLYGGESDEEFSFMELMKIAKLHEKVKNLT